MQIERSILGYGRFTNLKALAVYGGVSINNQIAALRRGVDIVVATPGRLIDHIQRDTIKLKNVVSGVVDDETQAKIDVVKQRLIKYFGYNETSATDVLNYVASIFARGDTKKEE